MSESAGDNSEKPGFQEVGEEELLPAESTAEADAAAPVDDKRQLSEDNSDNFAEKEEIGIAVFDDNDKIKQQILGNFEQEDADAWQDDMVNAAAAAFNAASFFGDDRKETIGAETDTDGAKIRSNHRFESGITSVQTEDFAAKKSAVDLIGEKDLALQIGHADEIEKPSEEGDVAQENPFLPSENEEYVSEGDASVLAESGIAATSIQELTALGIGTAEEKLDASFMQAESTQVASINEATAIPRSLLIDDDNAAGEVQNLSAIEHSNELESEPIEVVEGSVLQESVPVVEDPQMDEAMSPITSESKNFADSSTATVVFASTENLTGLAPSMFSQSPPTVAVDDDFPTSPKPLTAKLLESTESRKATSIKRTYSAMKVDSATVREESVRSLVTRAVDLEAEYRSCLQQSPIDASAVQQMTSAGATTGTLHTVLSRLVALHQAQNQQDDVDPADFPRLIRSLRLGVSARSRGPSRFFSFHGKDSCIEVSGTSTFAKSFPQSWGITAWIWLAPKCGPFTLASFLTKERYGVSVTILPDEQEGRDSTILFESADEKKRDGCRITLPAALFRLKTWHHVCIQQSRKKTGNVAGNVSIRLDDRLIEERPLHFPGLGLTSPVTRARLMEEFEGLSGAVWILNGYLKSSASLSRQQVTPILAEGEEAAPGLGIFVSHTEQDMFPPVFASYHPERVIGSLCLDLHGSHLGTLVGSCVPWTMLPARDVLRSIGGPGLLLPLFQPTLFHGKEDSVYQCEVILQSVLLLAAFLEAHTPNQSEFYDCGGVSSLMCSLEDLPRTIANEMLRDPIRDLVSALGSLTRAVGLDSIGTPNEGTRLMRIMTWRPKSVEFELDRLLIFNLEFWARLGANEENAALLRVVSLCSKRLSEKPAAYRKKFGIRYFLDSLRRLYEAFDLHSKDEEDTEDREEETSLRKHLRTIGSIFIDKVIAPLVTDHSAPISKDEVRAILDTAIGAGHGSISQPNVNFKERRKNATWDQPTVELAHDALRLLIRCFQQVANHTTLSSMNIPSVLAVEVVAFGSLGERIRALALRVIALSLAASHSKDVSESFASQGGYSYLSSALSHAVIKSEKRFAATQSNRPSTLDVSAPAQQSQSSSMMNNLSSILSPKAASTQRKSLSSSFASSRPFFLTATPSPSAAPNSSGGKGKHVQSSSNKSSTSPSTMTSAYANNNMGTNSPPIATPIRGGSFLSASEATVAATSNASVSHISDATYNALLSMVVTSCAIPSCNQSQAWRRASSSALADDDVDIGSGMTSPAAVLDDVFKIVNIQALSIILDQLSHMSPLVQQRTFQDLFVLLKFEPENRKAFCSIPNWQRVLASFLASHIDGEAVGVLEMGVKLWVIVLQDASLRDPDTVLDTYWLGESFGSKLSLAVISGLLDALRHRESAPPTGLIDCLVKVGELSSAHYSQVLQLVDGWKVPADCSSASIALMLKESTQSISRNLSDLPNAAQAARFSQKLLSSISHSSASTSLFGPGENGLYRDSAVYAVSRVHECLERLQGKTEFTVEEKDFLDSCALLLVEAARVLSIAPNKDSKSEVELCELAQALTPHKAKPMPREAWLHSRWAMNPLEGGFSSLASATLDDISFSTKRQEKDRYEARFSKSQERMSHLAKLRGDLESHVRDSEERFVYTELTRLHNSNLVLLNERKQQKEQWASFLREMKNGETVWKLQSQDLETNWICPEREDYLRRHMILEKNLNHRPHDQAAYELSLQVNDPSSVSKLAAATMNAEATQLPIEEDLERSLLQVKSSKTRTIMEKKEFTVPYDSKEEICYVAEGARWVTPSVVVSGRVEVSASFVVFYAADDDDINGGEGGDSEVSKQQSSSNNKKKSHKRRERWRLDELIEIHSRRYLLRPTAIELFFSDRTTAFFAFQNNSTRDECSSQILKQKPARLEKAFTGALAPPAQVFKRSKLTEMWRKREISNFEYLMRLNTIAGRTYNDVTQFFVFPWILTDYESDEISLDDHSKFRDLMKPVGALNAQRMAEVTERYKAFTEADMGMPPFHHGSHYSSAGVVLHYLIRVEPYTTLAIELQGGRFDVPDRLFHSVKDCFRSCYSSVVDCRELIPEFFYLPDMFVNNSSLNLGKRQDGNQVDNVLLPAWAKNDPERFVRMNRESLESEYVSENLHNWIDLIFGYKQRGKDAVEACNVFNHLSYEGAVDLDSISDPTRRAAVELQILEFGQCPSQLLNHPHPRRMSLNELGRSIAMDLVREAFYFKSANYKWNMLVWRKLAWNPAAETSSSAMALSAAGSVPSAVVATALGPVRQIGSLVRFFGVGLGGGASSSSSKDTSITTHAHPTSTTASVVTPPPVVSITAFNDRIVLVHADLTATVLHALEGADSASLELRPGAQIVLPSAQCSTYVTARSRDAGLVGTNLGMSLRGRPQDFICTQGGNLLVTCPYFDGSIRCCRMDGTKLEVNVVGHRGRVTSLAHDGRWLVSGSADGTAVLWKVGGSHDSRDEMLELFGETAKTGHGPLLHVERYLIGHHTGVTSVAVSHLLGVIATGAADGSLLVHALYDKSMSKTRSFSTGWDSSVDLIAVAPGSGGIVAHCKTNTELVYFSVNGKLLGRCKNDEPWNFCEIVSFHEQEVVMGGGDKSGEIWVRTTPDLIITRKISYAKRYRGIRCASVAPGGKYIYIGCVDGSVIVLGDGTGVQTDANQTASAEGGKRGMVVSE